MAITDPLRTEHADLRPQLDALDELAADLSRRPAGLVDRVGEAVRFLVDHLLPHAHAEESVLYPAVDQALGATGATATMAADHTEIAVRIGRLAEAAARLRDGDLSDEQVESLRSQLYGLSAILHLHFAKEEDVLLPILDATLDQAQAQQLFADMGKVAHPGRESDEDQSH